MVVDEMGRIFAGVFGNHPLQTLGSTRAKADRTHAACRTTTVAFFASRSQTSRVLGEAYTPKQYWSLEVSHRTCIRVSLQR